MKIKVESDVFDICDRVKEIDEGYFILYDTNKNIFELHNSNQCDTFCLTIPFKHLESNLLDLINLSSITNIDKIIDDIDDNNRILEENFSKKNRDTSNYMLREIYNYCSNSSKEYSKNSFATIWR